jgi:colanic acid/amylovoran biosynthesis glycosyltransferase
MKVAYIVSRFPKLTETFILNELFAVEKQGVQVELYPLQREKTTNAPRRRDMGETRALYPLAQPAHLVVEPGRAVAPAARVFAHPGAPVVGHPQQPRFFAGALAFFPKSVHLARLMRRHGIQHIHAHFASHPTAAAFIIHRLTGIPTALPRTAPTSTATSRC